MWVIAGFLHSAFTFGYESFVHKTNINGNTVPPGALISFVQKGLQYLELEANLNEEGDVADGEFAPLTPHEMLTLDNNELKGVVRERREQQPEQRDRLGKAKVRVGVRCRTGVVRSCLACLEAFTSRRVDPLLAAHTQHGRAAAGGQGHA
jgi:hypothetical protein